ncbi:MAG TPA: PDZ domain-containing protein, partial [Pirellulales bacterium]
MVRLRWLLPAAMVVGTIWISAPAVWSQDAPPVLKQPQKSGEKSDKDEEKSETADRPSLAVDDRDLELFRLFVDTLDQVERNYVKPVDRRELMEAAIRGVIEKLDPYSNFIGPEEVDRFRDSLESQFGGIGIQVTMDDGQLKVLSPLVGTPAYRAGIHPGDRITEIEGESTDGIALDEAVRRLKGAIGTSVKVRIQKAFT